MRPRISLEETTPLHKQRNCGGVRASIARGAVGVRKKESWKERERGAKRKEVAFITIVTKRLYSAGRKRKFLCRRLSPSSPYSPSFIRIRM